MEERKELEMAFNYYYGTQADQYNFIKVPKQLINDEAFADLSVNAKMLYGLLLDRMNLSMKNGWFDEENRVFIIYQITDIMNDLNMARATTVKYLKELVDFGLVEKKKRGLGLPNILYVKSFVIERDYSQDKDKINDIIRSDSTAKPVNTQKFNNCTSRSSKNEIQGIQDLNCKEFNNYTSEGLENRLQEVQSLNPNNTKLNNNDLSNNKILSNHIADESVEANSGEDNYADEEQYLKLTEKICDRMRKEKSEYELYMEFVKKHIEYDCLIDRHPYDKEQINGIVEIIAETAVSNNDYIVIASNKFPKEVVKSKLLKLTFTHIEYVLECLSKNATDVKNYKKYLLASLFNAPSTIHGYYESRVNHDMYS